MSYCSHPKGVPSAQTGVNITAGKEKASAESKQTCMTLVERTDAKLLRVAGKEEAASCAGNAAVVASDRPDLQPRSSLARARPRTAS